MTARAHDDLKESLLIEGLQDWVEFWEIHQGFAGTDPAESPPLDAVQERSLSLIRELVNEGLFVVGYPDKKAPAGFTQLSVDEAMAASKRAI
jgi:hypothetical protein